MLTSNNIYKHELIGLEVEIVDASHKGYIKVKGKVVDETKHMLMIDQDGVEKSIPKKNTTFRFKINDGVDVDGSKLLYRPEDRTKKARKNRRS
jgi:ribonuclease P protein subunit POP4